MTAGLLLAVGYLLGSLVGVAGLTTGGQPPAGLLDLLSTTLPTGLAGGGLVTALGALAKTRGPSRASGDVLLLDAELADYKQRTERLERRTEDLARQIAANQLPPQEAPDAS